MAWTSFNCYPVEHGAKSFQNNGAVCKRLAGGAAVAIAPGAVQRGVKALFAGCEVGTGGRYNEFSNRARSANEAIDAVARPILTEAISATEVYARNALVEVDRLSAGGDGGDRRNRCTAGIVDANVTNGACPASLLSTRIDAAELACDIRAHTRTDAVASCGTFELFHSAISTASSASVGSADPTFTVGIATAGAPVALFEWLASSAAVSTSI